MRRSTGALGTSRAGPLLPNNVRASGGEASFPEQTGDERGTNAPLEDERETNAVMSRDAACISRRLDKFS